MNDRLMRVFQRCHARIGLLAVLAAALAGCNRVKLSNALSMMDTDPKEMYRIAKEVYETDKTDERYVAALAAGGALWREFESGSASAAEDRQRILEYLQFAETDPRRDRTWVRGYAKILMGMMHLSSSSFPGFSPAGAGSTEQWLAAMDRDLEGDKLAESMLCDGIELIVDEGHEVALQFYSIKTTVRLLRIQKEQLRDTFAAVQVRPDWKRCIGALESTEAALQDLKKTSLQIDLRAREWRNPD